MKQQRIVLALHHAHHFADQNGVVAAGIARPHLALEDRRQSLQQRRAGFAGRVRHVGELVDAAGAETQSEIAMIGAEKMHREGVGGDEGVMARRGFGDAP